MNPVSILPAIVALIAAFMSAYLVKWWAGAPSEQGRFASIDGLRGYLAFFVFLHHSSIWFYYLRSGQWKVPPSNLYTHLGQSSVALFFMITGFLFFSKLIDGRAKGIDWGRLYVSRVLRLFPLYLFSMVLFFSIVAYLSSGMLHEPFFSLIKKSLCWIGFTIFGAPEINGVSHTGVIIAWVTWSLPYEWIFYFLLPIIAVLLRVNAPLPYIFIGVVSILCVFVLNKHAIYFAQFFGGILASVMVRFDKFREFSSCHIVSVLILLLIAIEVIVFPSAYGKSQLFLLTIVFSFIAGGNSLFGFLVNSVSRTLGEMAYSIYLLHGIFLFITFYFIVGFDNAKVVSPLYHWLLVVFITPFLVFSSWLTFKYIERPAMQRANFVTVWLRSLQKKFL